MSDELIEYSEGIVITRLLITVGVSPDKFVDRYEVQIKQTLDTDGNAVTDSFKEIATGKILTYQHLNVIDKATYQVRVRAVSNINSKSTFVSATRKIVGATEPPADVTNFSVNMLGSSQMQLNWDANTDLDISFYEIRYQNVTNNAQWNKSVNWLQVPRTSGTSITTNVRDGGVLHKKRWTNWETNQITKQLFIQILHQQLAILKTYKHLQKTLLLELLMEM